MYTNDPIIKDANLVNIYSFSNQGLIIDRGTMINIYI